MYTTVTYHKHYWYEHDKVDITERFLILSSDNFPYIHLRVTNNTHHCTTVQVAQTATDGINEKWLNCTYPWQMGHWNYFYEKVSEATLWQWSRATFAPTNTVNPWIAALWNKDKLWNTDTYIHFKLTFSEVITLWYEDFFRNMDTCGLSQDCHNLKSYTVLTNEKTHSLSLPCPIGGVVNVNKELFGVRVAGGLVWCQSHVNVLQGLSMKSKHT
jgi:hypothetical protein